MKKILLLSAAMIGVAFVDNLLGLRTTTVVLPASEIYAVDGDTIDHGDDRYRLVGFDTPEIYRAQCAAEKALGLKAKERLTEIIQIAGHVELAVQGKLDRYDRFLAVARAGDQEIGAILISEGLARPYGGGQRQPWCGPFEIKKETNLEKIKPTNPQALQDRSS